MSKNDITQDESRQDLTKVGGADPPESLEHKRLKMVSESLAQFGLGAFCENVADGVHALAHAACTLSGISTTGRPSYVTVNDIARSRFNLMVTNPTKGRINWTEEWLEHLRALQTDHQAVASLFEPDLLRKINTFVLKWGLPITPSADLVEFFSSIRTFPVAPTRITK
jgi:hypothetical protein